MFSSIDEVRGVLSRVVDKITDANGGLEAAIANLEAARADLAMAMQGSDQADVGSAYAAIMAALAALGEARSMAMACSQETEGVSARL